jgi:hypothetical protein
VIGEIDICGVFIPGFLIALAVALALTILVRRALAACGAYRLIWRASLFDFALAVVILGGVTAAQGRLPWI